MPINTKPKVELPVGNQLTDKMLSFEAVQPLYTLLHSQLFIIH